LIIFSGGSGYIAGHIIELLLQKGYQVRAIVRDLSNEDKIAHLKKLPQKDGQLTFKSAKIEDGAYGEVLKGNIEYSYYMYMKRQISNWKSL
jgi:dihydroflavonol-4-reductase